MGKILAKKAILKMAENVGNGGKPMAMSKALAAVGYSPSYSDNPQRFLRTKTAQELLEEYLPDELIAKRHSELLDAGEIQHYLFPSIKETVVEEEKEPQPNGGALKRKKKKPAKHIKKMELTNEEIKMIVESVPGCRLIYVKRDWTGAWAFFSSPNTRSRKDAIDMAYKRKGDYAAEKVELTKRKYQDLSNAELMALEAKLKGFLLKK